MERILPEEFIRVVELLKKLPGVGEKTAMRYAMAVLEGGYGEELGEAFIQMGQKIQRCPECNNISSGGLCPICADPMRDRSVVAVVKDVKDLLSLESSGVFNGLYHVLGGVLSPVKGVMPEDLALDKLVQRCKRHPEIKEVVVALDATVEGDTTALYIRKLLKDLPVEVTRPAVGIPSGTDIGYLDAFTLGKALRDRRKLT